jgi:hypothetical protein
MINMIDSLHNEGPDMVDRTALRTNQTIIILVLSAAWLAQSPPLVTFVAAVMLVGTAVPKASLFILLYRGILKPTGLLTAHPVPDREAPHRFAQGFGGIVVAGAYISLVSGLTALGWSLALVVVALALVNLVLDFCAGCFVFYQLERFGLFGSSNTESTEA